MTTTIKIILPVTLEDDIISVINDVENISTREYNLGDNVEQDNFNTQNANRDTDVRSTVKYISTSSKVSRSPRHTRQNHRVNNNQRHQLTHSSTNCRESQKQARGVLEEQQQIKMPLPQTQHQMSSDDWSQGHLVILDKSSRRARSSTATPTVVGPPNTRQQKAGVKGDVRLSATEAYDIDLEHRDIMMKALRLYSQYCRHEGSNHCKESNGSYRLRKQPFVVLPDFNNLCGSCSCNGESTRSWGSGKISRCVKMAQCRLRYYDDVDKATQEDKASPPKPPPLPHSRPHLYTLEDADGVLADAMGHTYRSTQTRPWSGLPGAICDIFTENQHMCRDDDRRFQKTTSANRCSDKKRRLQISDPSNQLRVVALTLKENMSQSIPRSVAYQRRNQTTHLWTDSSNLMSQSVPTASFLHRHFSSASSSPRSSRDDSSEGGGKGSKTRPSSSYSYDGGFFVGAHSGQAEYFVIHPDWVSEAMTVRKISLGNKKTGSPLQRSISLTARTLPGGRRCLSAPPKQRNPITMEHAESKSSEAKSQK